MDKKIGILFPISALPNSYGVGDFGQKAYEFVDKIADASLSIWQILPLNPLGYGNSPYQPLSSQAGDEIYLSLDNFVKEGLLQNNDVTYFNSQLPFVAFQEVRKRKDILYQKAFANFEPDNDYERFVEENPWVKEYALFKVFKQQNHEKSWVEWEEEYKNFYQKQSFSLIPFTKEIQYQIFLQYYFFKQWSALKTYANQKGIIILGDMPIYVGLDSVDVWTNQECFLLAEDGSPSFVAGVPPDYFSKFGQRWGNPIYDWEYLEAHHFDFWVQRMKAAHRMYDQVRIDHFRAFDTFWKIPANEPTAIIGEWIEAPGYKLFDTLYDEIPDLSILAEDLGDLRDEVYDLRDHYNLKGMFVFQFHYLDKFDFNKVIVYTGTHDNDTLVGWIENLSDKELKNLHKLLKDYDEKEDYQKIIHYCLDLNGSYTIVPVWDLMGCDTSCRFNVPGKIGSPNWEYRLTSFDEFDSYLDDFSHMIKNYERKEV